MQTLRLTNDELRQFESLPADIRGEWKTDTIDIHYKDSKEKMNVRLWLLRISSPELQGIAAAASEGLSLDDLVTKIQAIDLSSVSANDVREVLYALGPDVLGLIIQNILSSTPNEKDMEQVHAYATARALFFASLTV